MTAAFHDIRFPIAIALGAIGGPTRQTHITSLHSGKEQRISRWRHSKRRYNAGTGIKTVIDIEVVLAFFEERRGRLYGFRWKDALDFKSSSIDFEPTPLDQVIGVGDGVTTSFQLLKKYGSLEDSYFRPITKPVFGSILIAVDSVQVTSDHYSVDHLSGIVSFQLNAIPQTGAVITAGYEFDVSARFDADELIVDQVSFKAGSIPEIPILEVLDI